jgi:Na+/H+ antiporter NhaC
LTTAGGIYFHGRQAALAAGTAAPSLREILNSADSFAVLTWAALIGAVLAVGLAVGSRRLSLMDAMDGFMDGVKAMIIAVAILLLAWALSAICDNLGTANFLVEVSRQVLSARLLPLVVFVLAAAVSFATGTSWGTMAILVPLVYPLGHQLPLDAGLAAGTAANIHLAAVSAVLAGAVFGDHCSPISDTTILSSLATGSDHVDHVKTQMPYALTVAGVAAVCGYLPAGFGMSPWLSLALGVGLVTVVVWRVGKNLHQ